MTNHLIVSSFQNAPADLNTCPLSLQITTSDKSLILSLADCWTTPVQLPAIREKARSGWVNGGSLVPQSIMTSSTFPQPKQQRGCPNDMQYFHESDVAEIPYKKGEPCSRSYHDTIHDMWDKIAQLGQIIGGSSVLQSNTQLCDVIEPIPCITGVSFNDTSWGKLFKDTSWAEVFHDTAWAELFHDTSWIVNFNGPLTQRRTRHQDRRVSSTQRPFGRIIEFTLATTASSGQLRTSKKADEKRISIQILSTFGKSARCITTPPGLRCSTILHEPSSSRHFLVRRLQRQLSWQWQEPRRSRLQGSQRSFDAAAKQTPGQTNILSAPAFRPHHQIPPDDHYILWTATVHRATTINKEADGRFNPFYLDRFLIGALSTGGGCYAAQHICIPSRAA